MQDVGLVHVDELLRGPGSVPRPKLPEEIRLARRRLRTVTPKNAHKVLSKDIYWAVEFLSEYLSRCDELAFDDPHAGHRLALHAPSLAARIGVGTRPGEYQTEKHKRSFRVFALAVLAGSYRRIGELGEALAQYRTAFVLAESEIFPQARAELLCRFGVLQSVSKKATAIDQFNRALELFEQAADATGQAQALTVRAHYYWSHGHLAGAAQDLGAALGLVAGRRDSRSTRIATSAVGNLGWLVNSGLGFQDSTAALQFVSCARKRLASESLSVVKVKLYWIEGSLNRNICFYRPAVRLLHRAREGFRQLSLPGEFGLCSLELALALLDDDRFFDLDKIRADTVETLSALHCDPLLLETIEQWRLVTRQSGLLAIKQAVQKLTAG